ncbi:unnamed protein product [Haemonchus placei]|uniref:Transmembrane protein n=1 Tax=Haemonchus placei TaxID=6290 RepID=A0A0N4WIJ0_HAEPC|nr:unnamed protein product [Haemonchus placei]
MVSSVGVMAIVSRGRLVATAAMSPLIFADAPVWWHLLHPVKKRRTQDLFALAFPYYFTKAAVLLRSWVAWPSSLYLTD